MVKNLLRDPGTQTVLGGAGIGVALLALGVTMLVAFDGGDERTVGWVLIGVGAVISSIFLLGLMILAYEHVLGDSERVVRLRSPIRFPFHLIDPKRQKTETNALESAAAAADPERLIVFVKSWLMPAWVNAHDDLILSIRAELGKKYGEAIEHLYQKAIVESSVAIKQRVEARLKGEDAVESLISLAPVMYRHYEYLVATIHHCGSLVNQPYSDSQKFKDWQFADEKLLEKLTELIAAPEFATSELAQARKEAIDGGTAKLVRIHLSARPASGREGGLG